ncbi:C-type lectin domain family 2 member D11-like isoform X2 [Ovis canadensis]|uniref:C-type lectin domain family 2 member D11-like isoform X2 n=1 Tax=Ovis canadensis TaxID=37174 RepID=UPI003751E9DA
MWETAADGEGCGHPTGKLEVPGEGGCCSPETPHPPVWPPLVQSKAIVKKKPLPRGEEKEETAFLVSSKDLRKKCPAIGSPVTPAKLCCYILIIFILVALNVVTLSTLVAVRSRATDLQVLLAACPEGWIGFGSKCFYFSEDSENWTFSQTSCTSVGAVLAQFETEEELNFLQRYKGPFDHWIGLIGEPSHHAWKWTDNSKLDASFVVRGNGEYAFLNNFGITASINRAIQRRWICSKTNISSCCAVTQ